MCICAWMILVISIVWVTSDMSLLWESVPVSRKLANGTSDFSPGHWFTLHTFSLLDFSTFAFRLITSMLMIFLASYRQTMRVWVTVWNAHLTVVWVAHLLCLTASTRRTFCVRDVLLTVQSPGLSRIHRYQIQF